MRPISPSLYGSVAGGSSLYVSYEVSDAPEAAVGCDALAGTRRWTRLRRVLLFTGVVRDGARLGVSFGVRAGMLYMVPSQLSIPSLRARP
jgi:hypothetical protein